ncbi:hypothetical protein Tco_1224240, partial [Tanacetum coccineum]
MVNETTDQNMRDNLPMVVAEEIKLEREKIKVDIASMVADVTRDDKKARDADLTLWLALMYKFERSATHLEDFDSWSKDQGTYDDEVLSKEVSTELIAKISKKGMKSGPTVDVLKQMQDALNDIMRSRCNSGEEHQYHLDQMKSYMEIQIVWESNKEDLSLQIPKKPALVFHSCERDPNAPSLVLVNKDLFYMKNGNSKTRMYVVEHWKSIWAKKAHIKRQLKQRDDPEEVYSEQRIVNVIRVQYDQGYGQEYMKEIMVKRVDGEYK